MGENVISSRFLSTFKYSKKHSIPNRKEKTRKKSFNASDLLIINLLKQRKASFFLHRIIIPHFSPSLPLRARIIQSIAKNLKTYNIPSQTHSYIPLSLYEFSKTSRRKPKSSS